MTKIIHYRRKCIGCGICAEMQPATWRMSKKDGKATLLKATVKKEIFMLPVADEAVQPARELAKACPARIIKLS